jgi:hypothetical protein
LWERVGERGVQKKYIRTPFFGQTLKGYEIFCASQRLNIMSVTPQMSVFGQPEILFLDF